jgi:hypothetical protein
VPANLGPVQARHLQARNDHARATAPHLLQTFLAAGGLHDAQAVRDQPLNQRLPFVGVVLDDTDIDGHVVH